MSPGNWKKKSLPFERAFIFGNLQVVIGSLDIDYGHGAL